MNMTITATVLAIVALLATVLSELHSWKLRKKNQELEDQMRHLKLKLNEHYRWFAHEEALCVIIREYIMSLSDSWRSYHFTNVHDLRMNLGLEPKYNSVQEAANADHVKKG